MLGEDSKIDKRGEKKLKRPLQSHRSVFLKKIRKEEKHCRQMLQKEAKEKNV